MNGRLDSRLRQCAIQHGADLGDGQGAIQLLAIDEQCGSGAHAKRVAFLDGGFDRGLVLRLDARREFGIVDIVLLSLQ